MRLALFTLAVALLAAPASAQTAAESAGPDDPMARGREAYRRGVELSRGEQWGDALAAFEEAAAARDAPLIQFSIAYCERALGHYVAASRVIDRILRDPQGLGPTQLEDAKGYRAEFERILVRVTVRLEPAQASIAVDGRSLLADEAEPGTYRALGPPRPDEPIDQASFVVILDPGAHLFRAARPGHADALVSQSYRPGDRATLDLHLDLLPATVALQSEPHQGIVSLDRRELGVAPMEFQRPAGSYRLEVERNGFETYHATLALQPGQRVDLTAKLNPYVEPLTHKWWFWTLAGVALAGGAGLTYALTRPTPQPPAYDGGTANWVVHAQAVRW